MKAAGSQSGRLRELVLLWTWDAAAVVLRARDEAILCLSVGLFAVCTELCVDRFHVA